ncbi:MAG TPA: dipicolinate synthase subunit DpsA [Gaiellaceae bacterium]|nr:dipicolinate synthase subunit DpsA [Gaiellaceae bacterium]
MTALDWTGLTLAIVGGDAREQEICRQAAATGARVRAYGFPLPADGDVGAAELVADERAAMNGARYALFPIPLGYDEDHLYAPHAPAPIVVDEELFRPLEPGAHAFLGRTTAKLDACAAAAGVTLHEYDPDRTLMLERGPAIAEGTIGLAIQNTEVTINHSRALVVGYGNIGALIARRLTALGAEVFVAARNPEQRASAYANGATPIPLEQIPELAPTIPMIFNTAAAPLVNRAVLELLPRRSFIVDITPPPAYVDFDAAKELGHVAIWGRGLGNRAPVTVGLSQWRGIRARIEALETERAG